MNGGQGKASALYCSKQGDDACTQSLNETAAIDPFNKQVRYRRSQRKQAHDPQCLADASILTKAAQIWTRESFDCPRGGSRMNWFGRGKPICVNPVPEHWMRSLRCGTNRLLWTLIMHRLSSMQDVVCLELLKGYGGLIALV